MGAPELGRLYRADDNDVVHAFEITCAEYNIYSQDDILWLTLFVKAQPGRAPTNDDEPEPELELNLVLSKDPSECIRPGQVLRIPSYDEELYNLASMYYWAHSPFDGELHIQAVEDGRLIGVVKGESADDPVVLRAQFLMNPARHRSFS